MSCSAVAVVVDALVPRACAAPQAACPVPFSVFWACVVVLTIVCPQSLQCWPMKRRVVGVDFDADCDSDGALAAHLPHAAFPFQAAAATAPPRSSLLARDLARKWSCSLNTEIPTTRTHTGAHTHTHTHNKKGQVCRSCENHVPNHFLTIFASDIFLYRASVQFLQSPSLHPSVPPSLRLSFSVCLYVCACAGALQVIRMQFVYCRFLMTWACVRELVADLERFGFWDSVSVTLQHSAQSTQHTFVHHSSSLPIRLSIFCRCMHFLFAFCHTLLIIVAVLGLGEDRH